MCVCVAGGGGGGGGGWSVQNRDQGSVLYSNIQGHCGIIVSCHAKRGFSVFAYNQGPFVQCIISLTGKLRHELVTVSVLHYYNQIH